VSAIGCPIFFVHQTSLVSAIPSTDELILSSTPKLDLLSRLPHIISKFPPRESPKRYTKGGHTRLVPVQSSTMEALGRYRRLRRKAFGLKAGPRFFVNFRGTPLSYFGVNKAFHQLRRALGWTQRPIPRLHDLRHTFAVRTLLAWYRSGEPVDTKLWTLSTYLGHRHLADTYWYLSAVPELMQLCQQRFAAAQSWASQGADHE
jgi:integrase